MLDELQRVALLGMTHMAYWLEKLEAGCLHLQRGKSLLHWINFNSMKSVFCSFRLMSYRQRAADEMISELIT